MLRKQFWHRARQDQNESHRPPSIVHRFSYHVVVDRLILDGIEVAVRERPVLQTAVETELARLLGENGLSPGLSSGGAVPVTPGGALQLSDNQDPTALGQQIAQAVYGGIGK
jgi:hypothetical protein